MTEGLDSSDEDLALGIQPGKRKPTLLLTVKRRIVKTVMTIDLR